MCKFNEFHQHFLELERLLRCISKSFISACFFNLFKMFFYLCLAHMFTLHFYFLFTLLFLFMFFEKLKFL